MNMNAVLLGRLILPPVLGLFSQILAPPPAWAAQVLYPLGNAVSNDVLPGWPASNAVDGNPFSAYSSNVFPDASNSRGTFLAAWLLSGPESVNAVHLQARSAGGQAMGFPPSYQIYLTDPSNSSWIQVGDYDTQPDSSGGATVYLGNTFNTYGILLVPDQIGTDNLGNHFFQLAEMSLTNMNGFGMGSAASNDVLSGWPAANAIDGNPGTSYSSNIFPGAGNSRGTFLAAWLANGPQNVDTVLLHARMASPSQPMGFPASYTIYLTNASNSSWVQVGVFDTQPDWTGTATVDLGNSFQTYGVLLVPDQLGTDNLGNYFFQLAEVNLASAAFEVTQLNAQVNANAGILDYLVQDVCVNSQNQPIAGDPATCGAHRNIQMGESVPYILTDVDRSKNNATYEGLFSYPVPGADGLLKIMRTKSLQGSFNSAFQFSFDPNRDGYDLADPNGSVYSFIRTSDPGCLDQEISAAPGVRDGGWLLAPPGGGSGSLDHGILISRLVPEQGLPSSCISANTVNGAYQSTSTGTAEDVWNPPAPVSYESGKVLSSIIAYHFADPNLGAPVNAVEVNYLTREYGFARWEMWEPLAQCTGGSTPVACNSASAAPGSPPAACDPTNPNNPLYGRCSPSNIPGTACWGNQAWVRMDCRDSTNYIPLNNPQIPLDGPNGSMAQSDGLVDINSSLVFGTSP